MKLLIVVSKAALSGCRRASCTYIYLDNELREPLILFQAICRTNRLTAKNKDYGHIVDFIEVVRRRAAATPVLQFQTAGHR